ncbi:MAG: glycosyltransferase [Gammaproteobacteria bacterium]|nr:glycosyltransferase [Gammaproteobacteria bacterium]
MSVIVTFHHERLLAHWMLDRFARVRAHAEHQGLRVEMVCVLDTADAETARIVTEHATLRPADRVLRVAHGDQAMSRNDGVAHAHGRYLAIVDGDDYYSEAWLTFAYARARTLADRAVVHPEYVVSFGTVHSLMRVIDQERDSYPLANCLTGHPWVSTAFAPAAIFRAIPYQARNIQIGFGYEDWHWNLEVLAAGYRHVTALGTALYYRRKAVSTLTQDTQRGVTVRPSGFFRAPDLWATWAGEDA